MVAREHFWNFAPLVLLVSASCGSAYYLPGTYPQEFFKGDTVRGALIIIGQGIKMWEQCMTLM
jgi:hypothetical protein